jgi:hypothetical protein
MDPFDDCTDTWFDHHQADIPTAGHDHIRSLREVLPYAFGEKPRRLVDVETR